MWRLSVVFGLFAWGLSVFVGRRIVSGAVVWSLMRWRFMFSRGPVSWGLFVGPVFVHVVRLPASARALVCGVC
jgi:hypothetical protein